MGCAMSSSSVMHAVHLPQRQHTNPKSNHALGSKGKKYTKATASKASSSIAATNPLSPPPPVSISIEAIQLNAAQARAEGSITSLTEGVVELMLRGRRRVIFNDDTQENENEENEDHYREDKCSEHHSASSHASSCAPHGSDVEHVNEWSDADRTIIENALRSNEFFSRLDPALLGSLAIAMTLWTVAIGDIAMQAGQLGDSFYIVRSGAVCQIYIYIYIYISIEVATRLNYIYIHMLRYFRRYGYD